MFGLRRGLEAFETLDISGVAAGWKARAPAEFLMSLTLGGRRRKSKGKVPPVLTSFYAQWRVQCGVIPLLREDRESPPERLLQSVWQHQRLLRDQLQTLDGEPVRVLHPGFLSVEGGPDFRGAVVQIGDGPARTGDVEVDLRASGWRAHGHDRNPAFEKVILHVIWEGERGKLSEERKKNPLSPAVSPLLRRGERERNSAVVALRPVLDAPLGELSLWLGSGAAQEVPKELRGKCSAPLRELSEAAVRDLSRRGRRRDACATTEGEASLRELLHEAAQVRLQSKAAQFQARARQAGWEQALWEGLFRALGYKHNIWPMQRLAELRPRWADRPAGTVEVQARLLGLSGLLPGDLSRSQSRPDQYLRRVWDQWWRERDEFSDCILPRGLWRLHGLRPANHPQRRLALASAWSVDGELGSKLERWCARETPDKDLASSLLEALQVEPDDFWSWHCTFSSARLKRAQPLLGGTRATDLAVNVVLPWLWIRAAEGKNEAMQRAIEHRYFAWPPAGDNALLRLARQRLLGGAPARVLSSAAAQQGLIQIVRDFCERSNALCENCQFPELVKEWRGQRVR